MPRVSQKDALKTRAKIVDVALELLLAQGLDALTFTNIAVAANIGRSSINNHFKVKQDLMDELRPRIGGMIELRLDFSSGKAFYDSWVLAIKQDQEFRKIINGLSILINSDEGVEGLKQRLVADPENAEQYIYMAIGYAVVNLPHYD